MTLRIGHLSDCHLGFRAHQRSSSNVNMRERDVAMAFHRAIDGLIAARPDAVLIAGDLFHEAKPSNTVVRFAVRQLQRLRAALPGTPIVICAGNHDTNRRVETGCILPLLEDIGLADVAHSGARQFAYPALDLRVVAVPHEAVMTGDFPEPESAERFQVLLAHAEVQGIYRKQGDRPSGQIPAKVIARDWAAVCLGDYHLAHQVGPRAWYSGSLELTSSNPWSELHAPKGWLLWDLEAGTVELQQLPPCRPHYDLGVVDALGQTAAEVMAVLADLVGSVDITDAIVRCKVVNIPTGVRAELDYAVLRQWKGQALNFKLDLESPARIRNAQSVSRRRGQPLAQVVAEFLDGYAFTPGIDGTAVAAIGRDLLASVEPDLSERTNAKRGVA